jgi:hypothetical protein
MGPSIQLDLDAFAVGWDKFCLEIN